MNMTDHEVFLSCISYGLNTDITCYVSGLSGMVFKVCIDDALYNLLKQMILNALCSLNDSWKNICDNLETGVYLSNTQGIILYRMLSRASKQLKVIDKLLIVKGA